MALERIAVDPKIVDRISRSARMTAEQGGQVMAKYGGPGKYKTFARLPREERLTYAAISEGYTDPAEIEVVTGMTAADVSRGLAGLRTQRLIAPAEVTDGEQIA
jgi:hypothetical protein